MTDEPAPLAAVLGRALAERRREMSGVQQDVASAMRKLGFAWQRSTVAAVEAGKKEPSLGELAGLCCVLEVRLADLLPTSRDVLVRIGPSAIAETQQVRNALESGSWFLTRKIIDEKLRAADPVQDEAEHKAMRRLGRSRAEINRAATKLWGSSLVERREELLGPDAQTLSPRSLQARRGHASRQLLAELADYFDREEGQAG